VFRVSIDAIVFVDNQGTITGWSDSAERMFGVTRQLALGGSLEQLFAGKERRKSRDALSQAARGKRRRVHGVVMHGDGSRMFVEALYAPVEHPQGQVGECVVVLRDITELSLIRSGAWAVASEPDASKALASFTEVLEQVMPIDHLTLTALEGDEARRVASVGRSAESLPPGAVFPLAGTPLSVAAKRREPIVCSDTTRGRLRYDEILAETSVRAYVVVPLVHRGRVVATLNVGFASTNGPTAAVVQLLTSVSDSIMPAVLNLVALKQQAATIERLERLDALKDEVIALIAHDIRTPLAIIGGFAEHLQDQWDQLSENEKRESVATILRNALKLYTLAEQSLQVTRLESGVLPYELRLVSLEEEVARTVADLATADAARIHVDTEGGLPPVRCDPERHWQVLMNLLSNALKFSPPETVIEVELSRKDEVVEVAVRDRGPGISREDLPRLFHKFSRIGGHELEAVRGTGLGLYISKALVEAQAGRIRVESVRGRGSTFAYTLPIAPDRPD
jgi:PAS domain S-box-containing protein